MRTTVLIAAAILAGAAQAEEPMFLFDALRLPKYHNGWEKLIKDVQPIPDWLLHFSHNYDGASGELKPLTIEGKPFQLSYVCKPEDCDGHKFEVLFAGEGGRAVGALGGKDEPPAFYGNPTAPEQEAMTQALHAAAASAGAAQPKSD